MSIRLEDTVAERAARARSARTRRPVVGRGSTFVSRSAGSSAVRRWRAALVVTTHRPQGRDLSRDGRARHLVALERVVNDVRSIVT